VIRAVVYGLVQEELIASFPQFHLLLYGGFLILIILFEPGGVLGLLMKSFRFLRARNWHWRPYLNSIASRKTLRGSPP
jgi:hypothetical protein